jgi:hypothetical protein
VLNDSPPGVPQITADALQSGEPPGVSSFVPNPKRISEAEARRARPTMT